MHVNPRCKQFKHLRQSGKYGVENFSSSSHYVKCESSHFQAFLSHSCCIFDTRLNYGRTHEFQPIHLVLETFWDTCSSSEAYNRSDSAIFHSLSIPFKVSLDLLFTDSHLHCQGASWDLNQVLHGPARVNIFTRVCLRSLIFIASRGPPLCLYEGQQKDDCTRVCEKDIKKCVSREMSNEQQVHTSVARREGQVAMTLLISKQPQA